MKVHDIHILTMLLTRPATSRPRPEPARPRPEVTRPRPRSRRKTKTGSQKLEILKKSIMQALFEVFK